MTRWLHSGEIEPFKAGCHSVMLGLAALFTVYNALAWAVRREQHLGRNVVIYGALTALEALQVQRHRGAQR